MTPLGSWTWRSAAAAFMLLLACLALGAAWLAGSEAALRWMATRAVAASAGRLALQDVSGSLYGQIRVGSWAFRDGDHRIEGRGLALAWSPRQLLLDRRVHISSLELQSLLLSTANTAGEPPRLPQTLRLPLQLEIRNAKIGALTLSMDDARHEFRALTFSLENPDGRFQAAAALDTPWGRGVGELKLDDSAPFALHASASLRGTAGAHAYSMDATLQGVLADIGIRATAAVRDATAELSARVAPLARMPLQQAALRIAHLDASKFGAGLPRSDVAAELMLRAQPEGTIAGEVKLSNALPGSADAGLLPLRAAQLAYEGSLAQLTLHGVNLDLGKAGRFAGKGSLREGRLALDLATAAFDLHGVHARLAATKLAGRIELDAQGAAQELRADLRAGAYRLRIDAAQRDAALQVRAATISIGDSELALSGAIALAQQNEFRAQGKLTRFDPSRLGDYPSALINGSFSATGRLSPRIDAMLQFALADSRYRGHRLRGDGKAKLTPERIWESQFALELGANRLSASGAFGAAGDAMDWRIEAPNLGEIAAQLGGRLRASGRLEGTAAEPAGAFQAEARNIVWAEQHRVAAFSASGSMDRGADGTLKLDATLRDYRSAALRIDTASAAAKGRRSSHELSLAARNAAIDISAALAGAWQSDAGWSGRVLSFENRGRYAAALEEPASLTLKGAEFALGAASLRFARGTVRIAELARRADGLFSAGSLSGLDSAYLLGLAGEELDIASTLTLGGTWKLAVTERINGEFALEREQGDVTVLSEPPTSIGLTRLRLAASAVDDRLSAQLEAKGKVLGEISASLETTLARRGASIGLPGTAALAFDAALSMPSLAWTMPLMGERMVIDGRVQGQIAARGSVAQPLLSGSISADGLKLEYPEQGVDLKQGSVRARLQDNQLLLESMTLRAGEGTLEGSGSLEWKSGKASARLALKAHKFEALRHLERHLVLSGSAESTLQDGNIHTKAALKADRGEFVLADADAPSLSADVVVLGRSDDAVQKKSRFATGFEFELDLGEQFRIKGKGLDARLAGLIKLRAGGRGPATASGSISVAQGSYSAYGQQLAIERGILNFAGPLDNPGLDIVALRKRQAVEAGVAIRGTALAPKVSLVSNPPVPDSEKLSWLILGHGMESSNKTDMALLHAAAGALLGRGESLTLQNRIARAGGLDEFGLAAGSGLESAVLTLGKRLSSRAYLTVEQGLGTSMNLVKISYALTPRFSVRAATGTESAVDAFYTFSFK